MPSPPSASLLPLVQQPHRGLIETTRRLWWVLVSFSISSRPTADGHAVTVLPSEVSLTPAEAAELLGSSRPFVARLLDESEIPSERLPRSRHRRVLLSDVLAFQAKRERRREGRRRIAAAVEEADLPY